MKIKFILCLSLLFGSLSSFSQNEISSSFEYFGPYKVFVNGSSLLKSKKKKYNDNRNLQNEDLLLYQIDADRDKSTFSSSAVSVNIPSNSTIEKAIIVWSCNYDFCFVNDKKNKKNLNSSNRKPNDGTIKLKTPFQKTYQTLNPKLLVDNSTINDINSEKKYRPSVFSLDITDMLKDNNNVNGLYWLANYYTIQGQTLNGISSGWSIVIVYKSPDLKNNLVSGLIGYNEIKTDSTYFFKFPKAKNTFTNRMEIPFSLTMFTLGGDPGEGNESFYWFGSEHEIPVNFENRYSTDILSGTIDNFGERLPNLKNNFGVDIFNGKGSMPSYFFENNNSSGLTLAINSKNNKDNVQLIYSILEMPIADGYDPFEPQKENIIENTKHNITQDFQKNQETSNPPKTLEDDIVIKTYKISNLNEGYYIINGVFSKEHYREKWIQKLKSSSNYNISFFNNPLNGFDYIFCHFNKDLIKVKEKISSIKTTPNFKESWVLEVQN